MNSSTLHFIQVLNINDGENYGSDDNANENKPDEPLEGKVAKDYTTEVISCMSWVAQQVSGLERVS